MADKPEIPESGKAIDAGWLQRALAAGGAPDLPAIRNVAVEDIGDGIGLMGEIVRCHVTWEKKTTTAPESVVVKLPSQNRKSLRLDRRLSLYKREYDYYRHIGGQAPIRSPALLYGDYEEESRRFVLVLEDLRGMTSSDQIVGATAAQARTVVRALARLHGFYWNMTDRPPASGLYDGSSPKSVKPLQLAYLANLAPALDHLGGLLTSEMRRLARAYRPLLAEPPSGIAAPMTVIHGDVRLDNMFFDSSGGDDVALVDWQACCVGYGLYDVAYFLGGSVPVEVRREIEREALGEYWDIVCGMGVRDFAFEDCWWLYRQSVLSLLLPMVVICGGLDVGDDRTRRLMTIAAQRTLAAIEDLNAAELLPARPPFFSVGNGVSALFGAAYRVRRALR